MAGKGRKSLDDELVMALACGATVENAARKAGVSDRTVYRRLAHTAFLERLKVARLDLLKRTCGLLTAGSLEAVKTMLELQKAGTPPTVRLGAARSILEMALRTREHVEFEDRLSALEKRIEAKRFRVA